MDVRNASTLSGLAVRRPAEAEDALEVCTPERPYTMYCGSLMDKKLWISTLRKTIAALLGVPETEIRTDPRGLMPGTIARALSSAAHVRAGTPAITRRERVRTQSRAKSGRTHTATVLCTKETGAMRSGTAAASTFGRPKQFTTASGPTTDATAGACSCFTRATSMTASGATIVRVRAPRVAWFGRRAAP